MGETQKRLFPIWFNNSFRIDFEGARAKAKRHSRAGRGSRMGAMLIPLLFFAVGANVFADDISGTVIDSTGKPVSGVKIVAANPPDKPLTQAVTDGDGSFMLSGLPDGTTNLTLDPGKTTFKGSMVLASLDNQGINVAFAVSSAAPPIATATKPAEKKDHDPPAAYVPATGASSAAWIAGGTGAVAFATLGGWALGGVFDGPHHQKKQSPTE